LRGVGAHLRFDARPLLLQGRAHEVLQPRHPLRQAGEVERQGWQRALALAIDGAGEDGIGHLLGGE